MNDFYSSTNTDSDSYKDWTSPFTYDTHYDRRGWWYLRNSTPSSTVYEFYTSWMHSSSKTVTKTDKSSQYSDWGRVRDTFLDGKCLSVEEFQSCLWYYIPRSTFRWVETVHHTYIITTVKLIQTTFLLPITTLLLILQ